jgi:2-polyprenyl-3-methyl-5-hydroxy-6-metoxy-1,4-benzoquinol methylase
MVRDCPICFSSDKIFLYKQCFNNKIISLMDHYNVVACKCCGFVYADNIPSQDEFSKYYAEMSKYEFTHKEGFVANDHINYFNKVVNFLSPYIDNKNISILDIGCSTGALLNIFKSRGYCNLWGIDPSLSCVNATKKLYDINASVNNIANFDTNKKFDVIVLSATLEHLVDFNNSMKKINLLLKDQGLLFIEVPDAERFHSYISAPFQQFSIEHINYFSQHSIINLLASFSFDAIKIQQDINKFNLTTDPDLFVLATKIDKNNFKVVKDNVSKLKVQDYITQCSKIDLELKNIIRKKLAHKNKIIVWGAGTHTQRLLGSGLDLSRILFFVDSNVRYIGKKLRGIKIKAPHEIEEKSPILISTYAYQDEIAKQIKETLKLNNEVIKLY